MLTLEETLKHQLDLKRLCADRNQSTWEAFKPNDFYGIAFIIKKYANLPIWYSLKAIIPHGIVFDQAYVWTVERKANLPLILCYPDFRKKIYSDISNKRVVLSAAPYLYALKLLKDQPQPERRGTIFFPHHSTHNFKAIMDLEKIAKALNKLEKQYQPITICMYWRDVNLGHHEIFLRYGFDVVSAGHIFDPFFLSRFYHICSLHRYAAGNSAGSHIFYSIKAGCSYFHLSETSPVKMVGDIMLRNRDEAELPNEVEQKLKYLFQKGNENHRSSQTDIADYYLGANHQLNRTEMRRLLFKAEFLDKLGFRNTHGHLVVPPFWHRVIMAIRARVRYVAPNRSNAQ